MGLFDKLFHRKPDNTTFAPSLSALTPIYAQNGTYIFLQDVVMQALRCIVGEMKKLNPSHVRYVGSDPVPIPDSTVQKVLNEPNPLMTTSEFLEKTFWLYLLNSNVFIVPEYRVWKDRNTGEERRYYEALWPINPILVEFIRADGTGRLYVEFTFADGKKTTFPYDDVIHFRRDYSVSEYMGGNKLGQPENDGLRETLKLNDEILKGIAKSLKASYAINGVIKYGSILSKEENDAAMREFNDRLLNNESGYLPLDLKGELIPLERKGQIVDSATLKFIDDKILRYFGVPLSIVQGDFTKETYESFYQATLEGMIKAFSQALTKKLFTDREKAFGNRVELYPEELIFMSIQQKIEMVNTLSPTGGMFENEKRVAFGLKPLPELEGKRFMSLNWIDAANADQYQVGTVNVDVVDEEKQEV